MPATATTYQPHLLDPHSATPQPVSPANGKNFKLAELYQLLDCRTVDVVRLSPDLILIIDDEALMWPQTIRTEQTTAHTMQRLHDLTSRLKSA